MIKTFDLWIPTARVEKAVRLCTEQAATQEGQKELLQQASEGDSIATDYLYFRFKKLIASVFWKTYLGPDKKYWKARINAREDEDFASYAYEVLSGRSDPSPYNSFKPGKFDKKADLIKLFGYYLYRYLQHESRKLIKANKMQGMTGNVGKNDDIQVSTYSEVGDENPNTTSAVANMTATTDSSYEATEVKETLKAFLAELKQSNYKSYTIFKLRLTGLTPYDIAEKLGVSHQTVHQKLKDIKQQYFSFIGE